MLEQLGYHLPSFNCLPTIEAADAGMRRRNRLALAFSRLGPIFIEYNVYLAWDGN